MELLRYQRNIGPLTPQQQAQLGRAKVCIIGCGGIGGYTAEFLCRLGVGRLTLVDGDRFDPTNLNRQLFSTEENIGTPKVYAAKERLAQISSSCEVEAVFAFLDAENADSLLRGHDLVIDGLDRPQSRLLLQDACQRLGLTLIHGAVDGWGIQVCTVPPGARTLSRIYPTGSTPMPADGTLAFVAGCAGSLQAGEAVKALLHTGDPFTGRILFADLLANRFDILPI